MHQDDLEEYAVMLLVICMGFMLNQYSLRQMVELCFEELCQERSSLVDTLSIGRNYLMAYGCALNCQLELPELKKKHKLFSSQVTIRKRCIVVYKTNKTTKQLYLEMKDYLEDKYKQHHLNSIPDYIKI